MSQYRVYRRAQAKPGHLQELLRAAIEGRKYIKQKCGVETDIYCTRFGDTSSGTLHIFVNFSELSQIEQLYQNDLLKDEKYLSIQRSVAGVLEGSVVDCLLSRVDDNDFFVSAALS